MACCIGAGIDFAGDRAALLVSRDQPGVGEHVEVLHHRRQRHVERLRQFAHGKRLAGCQPRQQAAPGAIRQRGKDQIEAVVTILNHMV